MKDAERRAARAAYKGQKAVSGVYAVRCAASDKILGWANARCGEDLEPGCFFVARQGKPPPHDAGRLGRAWR